MEKHVVNIKISVKTLKAIFFLVLQVRNKTFIDLHLNFNMKLELLELNIKLDLKLLFTVLLE